MKARLEFCIRILKCRFRIKAKESREVYGYEYLYAGPLFIHQLSHLWIDFRGIQDDFNRKTGIDYFENTRRATYVQRQYGIENPLGFAHYNEFGWGLTASDGPGPAVLTVDGVQRTFYDYIARGAPFGPDDGTIAPWAVVTSLPFAPEIVIKTIRHALARLPVASPGPRPPETGLAPEPCVCLDVPATALRRRLRAALRFRDNLTFQVVYRAGDASLFA